MHFIGSVLARVTGMMLGITLALLFGIISGLIPQTETSINMLLNSMAFLILAFPLVFYLDKRDKARWPKPRNR